MTDFISGLELNRLFYTEAVKPILDRDFPDLPHTAARLGSGSEVLGYDDQTSTDHDWGPRFQLFLTESDHARWATAVVEALAHQLPHTFRGYPTNYNPPNEEGTSLLQPTAAGPINHRVDVTTLNTFLTTYMAYDPAHEPTVYDWLTWPQQHLLGVTKGAVYHDGWGELQAVRQTLAYYPHDVWLYLLLCQWSRIGQEEHFIGRTGSRDDELGSRVMASRLVHDMMLLSFLQERRYAPYPKWLGTAFKELTCADTLTPIFHEILDAPTWTERQRPLAIAYEFMAHKQNQLGLTDPIDPTVRYFHERPFLVIDAGRFVATLRDAITDPAVKAITIDIGSIDQFSNNTDLRSNPRLHNRLQALYQ